MITRSKNGIRKLKVFSTVLPEPLNYKEALKVPENKIWMLR